MISHGYVVKEHDDPIVDVVEAASDQGSDLLEPGAFLVDMIPLCTLPFSRRSTASDIDRISPSLSDRDLPAYSALHARVVPWSGMESEGQAFR